VGAPSGPVSTGSGSIGLSSCRASPQERKRLAVAAQAPDVALPVLDYERGEPGGHAACAAGDAPERDRASLGTSAVTSFAESTAGIEEGSRSQASASASPLTRAGQANQSRAGWTGTNPRHRDNSNRAGCYCRVACPRDTRLRPGLVSRNERSLLFAMSGLPTGEPAPVPS
jgi:hypothetical protein